MDYMSIGAALARWFERGIRMAAISEQMATSPEVRTASPGRFRLMPMPRFSALSRSRGSDVVTVTDRLPGAARGRTRRRGGYGLLLSLIAMVVVPTGLAGYYYGFVAADMYASEAKFAVRGAVEHLPKSAATEMFTPLTAMNSNQDAYIVAGYIESLPLIEKVQATIDIRSLFSRPEADPIARLDPESGAERLKKYWRKMVKANIDNLSGVVTLHVSSFTPADSLAISQQVLIESEKLVNDMSRRKNSDAVTFARDEVTRAESRLRAARLAMQDFRNQSGQLDPVRQAEAVLRLGTTLKSERMVLENEISAARRTLSETAPSVQVLNARLNALKEQIATVDRSLTGGSRDDKTASGALYRYEGLELERMFAEKIYAVAQTAYERARATADRQNLYLVTFVQPAVAETPTLPRRGAEVLVVFVCAFALWSVISLVTAAIKDHNA